MLTLCFSPQEVKAQMAALLKPEELQQYVVKGSEADFAGAGGGMVSVRREGDREGGKGGKRKEGMLYAKHKKKKKSKVKV